MKNVFVLLLIFIAIHLIGCKQKTVKPNSTTGEMVTFMDFFPTLSNVVSSQINPTGTIDGIDLSLILFRADIGVYDFGTQAIPGTEWWLIKEGALESLKVFVYE